jgi:hypothetical protein
MFFATHKRISIGQSETPRSGDFQSLALGNTGQLFELFVESLELESDIVRLTCKVDELGSLIDGELGGPCLQRGSDHVELFDFRANLRNESRVVGL